MGRSRDMKFDTAYALYKDGLSLSMVAEELGVTRQCVYKAFKKRQFKLRTVARNQIQIYDNKTFSIRKHGYFALTTDNRCLMHRYVWEKEVGKIPDGWDIHHINNNKHDNRIVNLECLPKSEHTRKYSPHNNQYTKGRIRVSY